MSQEYNSNINAILEKEETERSALMEALQIITTEQIKNVEELRKKYPLDAVDLVSSRVKYNSEISSKVKTELGKLHTKIRFLINEVATSIENPTFENTKLSLENEEFSYKDKEKAISLINADKERMISIRSLNLTIEVFNKFNIEIEREINNAINSKNTKNEKQLLLSSALIFYELTDYLINYIDEFSINGIDELKQVYASAQREMNNTKKYLSSLEEILDDPQVYEDEKMRVKDQLDNGLKALKIIDNEWKKIFDENDKFNNEMTKIIDFLPTLRSMKKRAETQLAILESISVLQLVKNTLGSFQNAFSSLSSIKLSPLSSQRVKRLLNINDRTSYE